MSHIPEHIRRQVRDLIEQELPIEKIAFMTNLSVDAVKREIERLNTTKRAVGAKN